MTVNIGDIIRLVNHMKLDGLFDIVNVMHFEKRISLMADDSVFMDDMAGYMDSAYLEIDQHISSRVTFSLITGQNLTQDVILPEKTWPTLVAGLAVDDMLPEQLAAYVFWRTARPRTRASTYLPPFTEGAWGGAIIPPAALTSMQNFGNRFTADFTVSQGTVRRGAFNPGLLRFEECITALRQTSYRTQRRRRIGVGS